MMNANGGPETPGEAFLRSLRDQAGVDDNRQLVGELAGTLLAQVIGYRLLRRFGAPRWAAYGLSSLSARITLQTRQLVRLRLRDGGPPKLSNARREAVRAIALACMEAYEDEDPGRLAIQLAHLEKETR
jgi:hypothetical protein